MSHVLADIKQKARELGAYAVAVIPAGSVDADAVQLYVAWVAAGRHGCMDYCSKYASQRSDTRSLLDGATAMVCCAYSYAAGRHSPLFADYAVIEDYHYHVKASLKQLGQYLAAKYGGETRAMVDTAPLRERYWAAKAGLGVIGINNQLIIPGAGSRFNLGFLLWQKPGNVDLDFDTLVDKPLAIGCQQCMACVKACPGGALDGAGGCDARRCASYLTIESKDFVADAKSLGCKIAGCDICQAVCPHNRVEAPLSPFPIDEAILSLSAQDLADITPSHYRRLTQRSALRRIPLHKLLSTLNVMQDQTGDGTLSL